MTLSSHVVANDSTLTARVLGPDDAAIFETFVVPRYLSFFAETLVARIASGPDARVCHVQCRTGYPDRLLLQRLPNAHLYGCDPSEHAIALARAKANTIAESVSDYRVVSGVTTPFPDGAFSHALTLHPLATPPERKLLLDELARITAPRGQVLVAMPLQGSFVEIYDLLREYALKTERTDLTTAVEAAAQLRPSDEVLKEELEACGFEYVDIEERRCALAFENGRQLFEDPIARLLLLPEFRAHLSVDSDQAFSYVRSAIDKYWSETTFELTVYVGVASGRRVEGAS